MSIFKCKMCGGALEISADQKTAVCEYCGTQQTLPRLDDDRRANLYDRANHFRRNNEFDKAMGIYEQILNEDGADAEAYWSIVLCRYGIEYVEDPATHKRVPTVNRAQFTSVFDDEDYKAAIANADTAQKAIHEAEAAAINEIQKGILAISQKEEPFDVFICYKETDANGRRTQDSVLANDLYHQLTQEGFKVFFSRITLEDKLGTAYEPYIFAALNSAKVMVVVGTKPEHFNAVWVKNEWSRYLALIKNGAKKVLIPAYRDMDPYELPEEFSHLQAQDMSKLGFMQDLIRGIKKIAGADESKTAAREVTVVRGEGGANLTALLKRGKMALEDGEWDAADKFFEQALNMDAECAEAYLGKALSRWNIPNLEQSFNWVIMAENDKNFQRAMQYADALLSEKINALKEKAYADKERCEAEEAVRQKAAEEAWRKADKEARMQACHELPAVRKKMTIAQNMIATGAWHIIGLKSDGTVVTVGSNNNYQCDVSEWRNIVAIAAGQTSTVGLRNDGTVVAVGFDDTGEGNLSEWRDISAIATGFYHTVGLKKDGTVVIVRKNILGVSHRYIVPDWKDIVAVAAGEYNTMGLKSDGTVVALGDNDDGQCNVSEWRDVVAVAAGRSHTVGIKKDGTVVAVGDNKHGQCDVSEWRDIVAVATGASHTVGIKKDGTSVAVGSNDNGQCDVSEWRDIVAVAAWSSHTVGLKKDGAVVVAARSMGKNVYCDTSTWKLFSSIDELEQKRKNAEEKAEAEREADEEKAEAERQARIAALKDAKVKLTAELPTLKGIFSGKRRKEIEARLALIEEELSRL